MDILQNHISVTFANPGVDMPYECLTDMHCDFAFESHSRYAFSKSGLHVKAGLDFRLSSDSYHKKLLVVPYLISFSFLSLSLLICAQSDIKPL